MLCLNFFMGGSGRRATYPGSGAKPLFVFIYLFLFNCISVFVCRCTREDSAHGGQRIICRCSLLPLHGGPRHQTEVSGLGNSTFIQAIFLAL